MVVLYNPHVDDFLAEPPHFRLLKRRPLKKYGFLISEALLNGLEVKVLVDGTISAFIPERVFHKLPTFLRHVVSELEYKLWLRFNKFGPLVKRVEIAKGKSSEVLLAFSYKAATGDFALRRDVFEKYHAVIFHLSHYFVSTGEKASNIKTLNNVWLAGDSDITNIPYFNEYFPWYKKSFLVLPFAVSPRFAVRKSFTEREHHCVATGSFHNLALERPPEKYAGFICSTQLTTYHPIRKEIFEKASTLLGLIECKVSPYRQNVSDSKIKRLISHFAVAQKIYFSMDIVDIYNDYQFAVVGEEASGFPALGAFEAMACGAILIAVPQFYMGLGVESGKHYVGHDGSVNGILSAMQHVKESPDSGAAIAEAGKSFVKTKYNTATVYNNWTNTISGLVNNVAANK